MFKFAQLSGRKKKKKEKQLSSTGDLQLQGVAASALDCFHCRDSGVRVSLSTMHLINVNTAGRVRAGAVASIVI